MSTALSSEGVSFWKKLPWLARIALLLAVYILFMELMGYFLDRQDEAYHKSQVRRADLAEREIAVKEREARLLASVQPKPAQEEVPDEAVPSACGDETSLAEFLNNPPQVQYFEKAFSLSIGCALVRPSFKVKNVQGDGYTISYGRDPEKYNWYQENCRSQHECLRMFARYQREGGSFRITIHPGGSVTVR